MPSIVLTSASRELVVTIDVSTEAVIDAILDRASEAALTAYGAIVMRQARASIVPSKKPSRPGSPPHGHTRILERFIRFGYDPDRRSVAIGAIALPNKPGTAPAALEGGGASKAVRRNSVQTITIQPRPFMGPALEQTSSRLPELWANSLRG